MPPAPVRRLSRRAAAALPASSRAAFLLDAAQAAAPDAPGLSQALALACLKAGLGGRMGEKAG